MSELTGQPEEEWERDRITRARAGDQQALEDLLAAHQDRIFRTSLGIVAGNQEEAFELAQEVLISAFRHFAQFRGESRFSTWLYRMTVNFAKNRAVAHGRRRARFVPIDDPRTDQGDQPRTREFQAETPSPRERAAGNEMMTLLHQRMENLPEEFRSVLILRYVEDRSYEEIADILGVPLGTIKSRINRGRAELRLLMADVLPQGGTQT